MLLYTMSSKYQLNIIILSTLMYHQNINYTVWYQLYVNFISLKENLDDPISISNPISDTPLRGAGWRTAGRLIAGVKDG